MKPLYLVAALLISFNSFAQDGFAKQFKEIINDTANGFLAFRGEVTLKGELKTGDPYAGYRSLVTLEKTSKNNIHYMSGFALSIYSYNALVADSVSEIEGKNICNEWKDKIALLLENGFVVKKYEGMPLLGKYGWNFYKGELNISIDLLPIETTDLNSVGLVIYYTVHKIK